jgi:hypothetical protein
VQTGYCLTKAKPVLLHGSLCRGFESHLFHLLKTLVKLSLLHIGICRFESCPSKGQLSHYQPKVNCCLLQNLYGTATKLPFKTYIKMKKDLLKIGIRYNAIYVASSLKTSNPVLQDATANLVAHLKNVGYTVEENLLHHLNSLTAPQILSIYEAFAEVLQLKNNWVPLVKEWNIPTNETRANHWTTFWANLFKDTQGTKLACGHIIPADTFPLERYNGCPFCGTAFVTEGELYFGQGTKSKVLSRWTDADMLQVLTSLLQSSTALDATQSATLKVLLQHYPLPEVAICMKETKMLAIDILKENGNTVAAGKLFQSPADILRYLWYKHTGYLQLVKPKTIRKRKSSNNRSITPQSATISKTIVSSDLKLKYSRVESKIVAKWINDLPLSAEKAAAHMHPQRSMWVRFIRALRLAEYSHHKGMERLKLLLDIFYKQNYEVAAGRIEYFRLKSDAENTFLLLKERPGLFARSLFSNMLWFGPKDTLAAFAKTAEQIPARLLLTLNSYAKTYFDKSCNRVVKPLGGVSKVISPNRLLALYSPDQLQEMIDSIEELCLKIIKKRFEAQRNGNTSIFIDPSLYFMPLPIGDRTESIQDFPSALMGTRFALEGNTVRLFMQWGKGLPKQHLDMDLSCQIAYPNKIEVCSYYQLTTTGAQHSGDIRSIPDQVGTAEYIELKLDTLQKAGAQYVSFTCNAYSNGSITPNLVVGWMNAAYPMKISTENGIAYDPSCVQHQIKIGKTLTKGLLFGVLDVARKEIIWMEKSFVGQTVASLDTKGIKAMLAKLEAKTTVGKMLLLKAEAQSLTLVDSAENADEVYDRTWAMNVASVSQLLIG